MSYNVVLPFTLEAGANVLVAGVAGKKIWVYGIDVNLAEAGTVQLLADAIPLSGVIPTVRWDLTLNEQAYFVAQEGEDLILDISAGAGGTLWFRQQ